MSRGTIHRTIRIDDTLWLPAKAKAEAEGIHLSDVIREALRAYVARVPAALTEAEKMLETARRNRRGMGH